MYKGLVIFNRYGICIKGEQYPVCWTVLNAKTGGL